MKCAVHAEVDAKGYCRNCGKALCDQCTRDVRGILYCEECLATLVTRPQPAAGGPSPAVATMLGFIPGLGAVYNGEYTKALVHFCIFAGLVTLASSDGPQPLTGLSIAALIVYMAVDAGRVARARAQGQASPATAAGTKHPPVGAYVLIALGVLMLLHRFRPLPLERIFVDFWPVVLIALGVGMLWKRLQRMG